MEQTRQIGYEIYKMTQNFIDVENELLENGGELTAELTTKLESNGIAEQEVANGLRCLISKNDEYEKAVSEEIKRLQALKKARANAIESLKRYLMSYMLRNGIHNIETPYANVTVNAGRDSVECDEESLLDSASERLDDIRKMLPKYIDVELKVKKSVLGEMLKAGEPTPATIVKRPFITIK